MAGRRMENRVLCPNGLARATRTYVYFIKFYNYFPSMPFYARGYIAQLNNAIIKPTQAIHPLPQADISWSGSLTNDTALNYHLLWLVA